MITDPGNEPNESKDEQVQQPEQSAAFDEAGTVNPGEQPEATSEEAKEEEAAQV